MNFAYDEEDDTAVFHLRVDVQMSRKIREPGGTYIFRIISCTRRYEIILIGDTRGLYIER